MRIIARPLGCAAAVLIAGTAALAAPAAAQAAGLPGTVPCSTSALVTAISNANSAGPAVVRLSPVCDYVLTTAAAPGDGLPPITGKVTLIGGPGTTISRSPAAAHFRILEVAPAGALSLDGITVAGGLADQRGGGIRDQGTLALRDARLTGNAAPLGGGLIVEPGAHATISNSVFEGNNAPAAEGGAIVNNDGALTVDRSTLSGNNSGLGGAVFTTPSAVSRFSRTVVTRNQAVIGGGFYNEGRTSFTSDRVVSNRSTVTGGGIFNLAGGTVRLLLTVITANSPDNCVSDGGAVPGCRP